MEIHLYILGRAAVLRIVDFVHRNFQNLHVLVPVL